MKKRIVSLSVLIAMLLAQLVACGDTPSGTPEITDGATDTTAPVVQSEYVKPNVNYNGETFTVATFNFDIAYAIANYTIINHEEETGDRLNDAIVEMNRKVEEELGITLEMYELTLQDRFENANLTKTMYAGDNEIQLAFPVTGGFTKLLGEPSLIVDLNTIPTLDLSHSWWDQRTVEEFDLNGVQYTVVGDACFFAKGCPVMTFFNKQLIEDNKLENPYQLVYDNKWTLDKMIEMATAAQRDVNNDNKVDELEDIYGMICQGESTATFISSSDVRFITKDEKGNLEWDFDFDRAAIVIEKIVPFIKNKSVTYNADDFYGKHPDQWDTVIPNTFMENRSLFFSNQLLMALDFRKMEADFGILPSPKFDETQEEYYSIPTGAWCDCVFVPSTNPNLEQVGHVLEALGYYSQQLVTPEFIETTVYDKSVRDEDSAKMVTMILDNIRYDVATLFDWGGIENMFVSLCRSNSTNLASTYEATKPKILDAMQKTMDALKGE